MFKNILVPTDGSELSRETARRAVSFAKESAVKIFPIMCQEVDDHGDAAARAGI